MNEDKTITEELGDIASDETEEKKAITRSIHIAMLGMEITVTSQDADDTLKVIRKIAEELVDKYKRDINISKDYV